MFRLIKILLLGLLFLNKSLFAQTQEFPQWRFSADPTHLLFNNFGLRIERQIKNKTIGLHLGVKVASKQTAVLQDQKGWGSEYAQLNFYNPVNNALTLRLNNKFYVKDPIIGFIEFGVFYRHWWIKDKYLEFENDRKGYVSKGIRREQQNIYGFDFSIGRSFSFTKTGRYRPFVDLSAGLGARLKTGVFETFNGEKNGQSFAYNQTGLFKWWPSVHFSLYFGLAKYASPKVRTK